MMPTIICGIRIPTSVSAKLAIRHRIPLLLHVPAVALLAVRSHGWPRRLPGFAFARLGFGLVGERTARGLRSLGVDVVESVDAAARVLAANVEV